MKYLHARHYKARSNPPFAEQLCKSLCTVRDCFVPRNDVWEIQVLLNRF